METKNLLECMGIELKVNRLRWLILSNPADIKLLKQEYFQLTGKRFRRIKND